MGRNLDSQCKKCRRSREKLYLKGARCFTAKCAIEKRNTPPGPPSSITRKLSEYGLRLREKQKLRFFYGVSEGQMRNYFKLAIRRTGVTAHNLLEIFESRLDNVLYRAKLARSRKEARQLIRHGFFTVNDQLVDIPSYILKQGDRVMIYKKMQEDFDKNYEKIDGFDMPTWLAREGDDKMVRMQASPTREEISIPINEQYIVEYYSRMIK